MLFRTLILKTAGLKPVERTVRGSRVFRGLVRRFIAGDSLEEALQAAERLTQNGFFVSLDYLGENTHSEAEALQAVSTYGEMLRKIAASPCASRTNISIKLTQCGLDQGEAFAEQNFRNVLKQAAEALPPNDDPAFSGFVRIDMEASEYTERTVAMMERVWPDHKNTGTVLQSYLYRTDDDVEKMIALQMRTRLVKGAYLEPPSVAIPEKAKVDEAYVKQAKRMLEGAFYPAFATHDEAIIAEIQKHASEKGISKDKYEFQMLYGIRRDLQERLHREGHRVRVYIPFGDSWYPYFTRRLAERPANLMFIVRSTLHK